MPRYFTKVDRETTIYLTAFEERLAKIIEDWTEHGRPKEWLTELKKTKSFLTRANNFIEGQCADEEFLKVAKLYRDSSLTLIPKGEYKKFAESATVAHIPLEAWGNLAETYIEVHCKTCRMGDKPEHADCSARKTMMMAGVPSLDDPVPEERCQYFWFREQAAAKEKDAELAEEPEYYRTGIKMKNGAPHYKVRLYCKNQGCGKKANMYIPEGIKIIGCFGCGTAHQVRAAGPDGFPTRDEWGNFYIADEISGQ